MASVYYTFAVRDSGNNGARLTSLTPTFAHIKRVSDNSTVTATPTVTEIGLGVYKFAFDPAVQGEAVAQIDAGSTVTLAKDRYIDLFLTMERSKLTAGVVLDLTQAVPTSNTAQTVGDSLNAARAQGFGKWVLSGTTLTLYAANGSTVVRTFTLDNATSPASRT